MTMPPGIRKFALTAHILSSAGWIGALVVFAILAITGIASDEAHQVRASYVAMEPIVSWAIVPLAFASLVTGLVQSLGTQWGLWRHWWVVIKLLVTVAALLVLLTQVSAVTNMARMASETTLSGDQLSEARLSLVVHATGGVVVLLIPMVLSVYKPRGLTRYGQRQVQAAARGRPA